MAASTAASAWGRSCAGRVRRNRFQLGGEEPLSLRPLEPIIDDHHERLPGRGRGATHHLPPRHHEPLTGPEPP